MQRHQFQHDNLTFSYLDTGGAGDVLIALHAHWMEASTYTAFAAAMVPQWRVLALDQRGHGRSDHASSYTRDDHIGDLKAFVSHLGLGAPVVLLGNSLGGINAFQFAARQPDLVRALIIEDTVTEVDAEMDFILDWAGVYPRREDLAEKIGPRLAAYLEPSFRHPQAGWTLAFEPAEIVESQRNLNGDYWQDWLATDCPALLVRGGDSPFTPARLAEEMAARRPDTRLVTLKGGHVVHIDDPVGFEATVRDFLQDL